MEVIKEKQKDFNLKGGISEFINKGDLKDFYNLEELEKEF